jgi:hypothetical protein
VFNWYFDTEIYSSLGDFVSGISAPFIGLATFIIAFKVFILQKRRIKKNNRNLRNTTF